MINTHSCYSLKYGIKKPEEILAFARDNGFKHIAITDINNTSACLDFLRIAPGFGIKPSVGIDFRNGNTPCYVAIAHTNTGFEYLNRYLSDYLATNKPFPREAPNFPECSFIYPYAYYDEQSLAENHYVGIPPHLLNRIRFSKKRVDQKKLVAMPTFSFNSKRDFNAHRLLRAIDKNELLSRLDKKEQGQETDRYLSYQELATAYQDCPELLERTITILKSTEVSFKFKDPTHHENKATYKGHASEDKDLLTRLCREELKYRYPNPSNQVLKRLEMEIDMIAQKGFIGYFLMNWDITNYARHKNYYYVGRGSGANSIVAYLLRITDVDPIELDLYFERFINLFRQNPPDFDIDFSWRERDDVTKYIFKRFPTATLLGTYNTFQYRAVVRELGKVFGVPKHEIDELSRGRSNLNGLDQLLQLVIKYGHLIEGLPSHLSVHASGIVIPEKDITHFGGTFMPPKGFRTTQFSMIEAEDVGLYKFDILSQRGLSKIKECLEIIDYNQPDNPPEDIHNIQKFKKDERANDLLRKGKAIGCFYVESPAMRMLLCKLEVDNYLGLVAASSIIRPGVAKSGMMREYILRHKDPERRKEAHPVMVDIMPDTYGIMVYQEDVIKVAHYFAGLTLGEADELRRGMSGKYRSREEFMKVKEKFFNNCLQKGYTYQLTTEVWNQVESFAGYAFAKGHSASYAVESYQCLYLKAYYPLEFLVATINNYGGFYRTEVYVHEARMHGAEIHAPCINTSKAVTTLYGKSIYLGLNTIHSFDRTSISKVLKARQNGTFESFQDFCNRCPLGLEQLTLLIRMDAFRSLGVDKRELLWKAHYSVSKRKLVAAEATLFKPAAREIEVPELEKNPLQDSFDQLELLGYPLCNPFYLVQNQNYKKLYARDFKNHLNSTITIRGYLVSIKHTGTSKGDRMNFGTWLDEDGFFFDTIHFPNSARDYPFQGRRIYSVTGKVVEEFRFYSIEVDSMKKEAYQMND